jgi:hypothetical protein
VCVCVCACVCVFVRVLEKEARSQRHTRTQDGARSGALTFPKQAPADGCGGPPPGCVYKMWLGSLRCKSSTLSPSLPPTLPSTQSFFLPQSLSRPLSPYSHAETEGSTRSKACNALQCLQRTHKRIRILKPDTGQRGVGYSGQR